MIWFVRTCAVVWGAVFFSQAMAGTHVWSEAVSGSWSVTGNWSSGGAPTNGEPNLRLTFPSGTTRLLATNNIGPLTIENMTLPAAVAHHSWN